MSTIILAGGQSSRMGQDKALILVDSVPLLQRTCQIALQCTPNVLIVTSRPQAYAAIAPEGCQFIQEQGSADAPLPQGPLVALNQGLTFVKTDWVLVLACDLPYLQAAILQRWATQLNGVNSAIALLPQTAQGWEPLCGFYHTRCLATLCPFVQQGGRSFQRWLAQESVRAITFSPNIEEFQQEQKMLFNCNTPVDLALVQEEIDQDNPT